MPSIVERAIRGTVVEDLRRKMVFVSGPRQVGKTTLARQVLSITGGAYLNHDNGQDRRRILRAEWPAERGVVAIDELHKYPRWKRFIKGEYDTHGDRYSFLVTGSARLDVYRKGGDSLLGRYHHYRLHPFSLAELLGGRAPAVVGAELAMASTPPSGAEDTVRTLLRFGGFPEPFLSGTERVWRRWRKEYGERVVRQDVRDLSAVSDIDTIETLALMLPGRVGAPLSLNSLRIDLETSHRTVSHWVQLLESLYFCHRVYPYTARTIRSLRKEPKLYLWDWSAVEDEGARFENMIAGHLLKFCHYLEDTDGQPVRLWYLRDRDGREVDFLVSLKGKPWMAVETKLKGDTLGNLPYFRTRLAIPHCYLVHAEPERAYVTNNVTVVPCRRFLHALGV